MSEYFSLRQRLAAPGITIAPGIYDALGSVLVQQVGYHVAYLSGALDRLYPIWPTRYWSCWDERGRRNLIGDHRKKRPASYRRWRYRIWQCFERNAYGTIV